MDKFTNKNRDISKENCHNNSGYMKKESLTKLMKSSFVTICKENGFKKYYASKISFPTELNETFESFSKLGLSLYFFLL